MQEGLGPVGHFGFFRPRFRDSLWAWALAWLQTQAVRLQR
jgi:predicted alpha/beta hydrolase